MYAAYGLHSAMVAAALASPRPRLPLDPRVAVSAGIAAAAAGLAVTPAGTGAFAGPRQLTGLEHGDLVTDGIYRWTRNPQYLGWTLLLCGLATARRSTPALALAAAYGGVARWWATAEERHLAATFGDAYARYRARTRRWLGRPRRP
jgi:protein-S-isoprenylcysteine O-methyltransferase Ste14